MQFFENPAFTNRYEPSIWAGMHDSIPLEVDYDAVRVPARPHGKVVPVLNVRELPPNEVCEWFKRVLRWYSLAPFIAPSFRLYSGSENWVRHEFEEKIGSCVRNTSDGSYVFWAIDHVVDDGEGTLTLSDFDERMTVTEALLYHLYQVRRHGRTYLYDLHYSYGHRCRGSSGQNWLRFDLQDIKICLD